MRILDNILHFGYDAVGQCRKSTHGDPFNYGTEC